MLNEGSIYRCDIHDYETTHPDSWFKHKLSMEHYDQGISVCIYCKRKVKFDKLRQENMDYLAPAKCYFCAAKNEAQYNAKIVITKHRKDRNLEDCRGF